MIPAKVTPSQCCSLPPSAAAGSWMAAEGAGAWGCRSVRMHTQARTHPRTHEACLSAHARPHSARTHAGRCCALIPPQCTLHPQPSLPSFAPQARPPNPPPRCCRPSPGGALPLVACCSSIGSSSSSSSSLRLLHRRVRQRARCSRPCAQALPPLAMVNVDFASPSLLLGAALIGCGVILLQVGAEGGGVRHTGPRAHAAGCARAALRTHSACTIQSALCCAARRTTCHPQASLALQRPLQPAQNVRCCRHCAQHAQPTKTGINMHMRAQLVQAARLPFGPLWPGYTIPLHPRPPPKLRRCATWRTVCRATRTSWWPP